MVTKTADIPSAPRLRRRWVSDAIARIRAPIRLKLLFAFLLIAMLMVGLSFTGVRALQQANERTDELIAFQTRISALNAFERSVQEVMTTGMGTLSDTSLTATSTFPATQMKDELVWMKTVVANATRGLERNWPEGEVTPERVLALRQAVAELYDAGQTFLDLAEQGNTAATKAYFESQFLKKAQALDREVVTIKSALQSHMRQLAGTNAQAYLASQRLVVTVSVAAIGLALVLGYSLSGSIVAPIDRIRETLRVIARGDFSVNLEVPNRDEFQELAESVNKTTRRLGVLYDDLEAANRHKSQFLANMSHEFRTPMNSVLGYTELIRDGIYGEVPETIAEPLDRIDANGRALLDLINDVLDISKIEAGRINLQLDTYDLADVLQSTISAVEPMASDKGLILASRIPDHLPAARGDAGRIRQIVLNVLGNAVKFTEKGNVTLSVGETGGVFEIAVTDTGPGIPAADQETIFEEFHQADSTSTRAAGGTGLGLAIARRLAELHGGTIAVHSAPGKGAEFVIRLPVHVPDQVETP
ncbi:sensor histidine kinase [Ruegeria sediminis]|nr:ATP-binding protein [Ruegeria sediminis]